MSKVEKRDYAREELVQSLQSLLQSKAHSDLTVVCGGQRFDVHGAIMCPRSDFFRAACKGGFKEAETNVVELKEDDPYLVSRMITYLYTLDYENVDIALQPGHEIRPPEQNAYWLDINMYVMRDKFGIWGLKKTAEAKFGTALKQTVDVSDLLPVVAKVYESTPEHDRGLRDIAVQTTVLNLAVLTNSMMFKEIIADVPEFAYDIIKWTSEPPLRASGYCSLCKKQSHKDFKMIECSRCHIRIKAFGVR